MLEHEYVKAWRCYLDQLSVIDWIPDTLTLKTSSGKYKMRNITERKKGAAGSRQSLRVDWHSRRKQTGGQLALAARDYQIIMQGLLVGKIVVIQNKSTIYVIGWGLFGKWKVHSLPICNNKWLIIHLCCAWMICRTVARWNEMIYPVNGTAIGRTIIYYKILLSRWKAGKKIKTVPFSETWKANMTDTLS